MFAEILRKIGAIGLAVALLSGVPAPAILLAKSFMLLRDGP